MLLTAMTPPALWMYRNASAGRGFYVDPRPGRGALHGRAGQPRSALDRPEGSRRRRCWSVLTKGGGKSGQTPRTPPDDNLFSRMRNESRWRLREQGNAYLQLGHERALRTLVGPLGRGGLHPAQAQLHPQRRYRALAGRENARTPRPRPRAPAAVATGLGDAQLPAAGRHRRRRRRAPVATPHPRGRPAAGDWPRGGDRLRHAAQRGRNACRCSPSRSF